MKLYLYEEMAGLTGRGRRRAHIEPGTEEKSQETSILTMESVKEEENSYGLGALVLVWESRRSGISKTRISKSIL